MTRRILIAGCGDIGGALGLTLLKQGDEVFGLRRNTAALPPGLTPVSADLSAPLPPGTLPNSLDAVVYTAAATERSDAGYEAAYVKGVHHLQRALGSPTRSLFVSSTSVYGQTTGEWVDEASPTRPARFNGARVLEAEKLVHAHPGPSTCVRFGGIYGPKRTRLIRQVLEGTATLKPNPSEGVPLFTNRIHRSDCVAMLRFLLNLPEAPPVLIGVDNDPAPWNDVLKWLARRCRRPTPPMAHSPGTSPTPNKRCRNQGLRDLGYTLDYPGFRDGYGEILDDLRNSPSNS